MGIALTVANPETFDLFAFSSGATEPEEIVTIYMDGKTAQQILDTEKRIAQASSDEVEALEDEMEKLKDKFGASRLLVHVRSIPRRKRDQVTNEVDRHLATGAELEQQGAYTGAKQGHGGVQSGEQGHQNHGTEGDKQNLQPGDTLLDQGKHGYP
jgi:hypothetical protein